MSKNDEYWEKSLAKRTVSDAPSITPSEVPTENSARRRIKYGGPLKAAHGLFVEYCQNTSVHGLQYLGERKRTFVERIFWIIMMVVSLYFCGILIWNIYVKWDTSPVIVSFAEKSTPVWQIPFPAVTICPETKAKQTVFNFTEMFHRIWPDKPEPYQLTDEEKTTLEAVAQTCDAHLLTSFNVGNKTVNRNLISILREVAPQFNETLFQCKYRSFTDTCDKLFHEIITEEGICYTFNALDGKDIYREEALHDGFVVYQQNKTSRWSLEDGYEQGADLESHPHRVLAAGSRAGLFVLLSLYDQELDYLCRGPVQGFKILLHTPGELPRVSKQYFRVPTLQEVIVAVRPQMMQTSTNLKDYSPIRRQCFFNNERYLRYFKLYTQANCELECLANHTLRECGCVKFSMPRNKDTPVCGQASYECVNNAEDTLLTNEIKEGLASSTDSRRGVTECNCLPACTSITYDAEISQARFNWEDLFKAYKNPIDEFPGIQFARLSIFFKEAQFITSKRSELYGPTDFMANCGGLLGLFMGVSLLSIVELVYFCTVRLCGNMMMRRRKTKKVGPAPGITIDKPIEVLQVPEEPIKE